MKVRQRSSGGPHTPCPSPPPRYPTSFDGQHPLSRPPNGKPDVTEILRTEESNSFLEKLSITPCGLPLALPRAAPRPSSGIAWELVGHAESQVPLQLTASKWHCGQTPR